MSNLEDMINQNFPQPKINTKLINDMTLRCYLILKFVDLQESPKEWINIPKQLGISD